ncbi:MAG: succinate dehydrogenase/fumarate reductase iron-sulfur subunit [Spirochaetaceae bacterium]
MPSNTDTKTVTFTVSREQREAGRMDDFEVPCDAYTTVLDGLEYIRTRIDSTLMYRHSCHHGSCGTCGMIINGEKLLACTTNVFSLEADTVVVRPLPQFEAIGDLVVDPGSLFADFPARADYRRASEYNADARVPDEIEAYERFENCIECGLCVSACPVTSNWMGPAALAAWNRELEKNPERREDTLDSVDVDRGVWSCARHLRCSAVCPTGVYPARHIAVLKRAAAARREE